MNTDATQAPLSLPWFLGALAAVLLVIAAGAFAGWAIERQHDRRTQGRRADFDRHCQDVLGIARSVDALAERRRRIGGAR